MGDDGEDRQGRVGRRLFRGPGGEVVHLVQGVLTRVGTALGETVGYALTAGFTALVAHALRTRGQHDWLALLGYTSAALISFD